jgi:CRISPR-associated protein Csm5
VAKSKRITLDSRDKKPAETLEKGLLNYQKLENDPFRLLKVSDFHPIGPCTTKIIYAVNEKKEDSKFKARGPYQILEIIEPGAVFAGTIKVLSPLTREAIREPLTEKAVFNSAVTFYEKEKKLEDGEFNAAGITAFNLEKENDAYLLRLGRHSGAESITVEGYRHIKIMKKRGERPAYSDKATTFWLASDASTGYQKSQLRPFGWSALGKLTDELQATFKQLLTEQAAKSFPFSSGGMPGVQTEIRKPVQPALPVEEVWGNAFVAYNAGGPGKITAQVPGGKAAILQGRDKLKGAVAEVLHKKLFEGKKQVPKACVTVRKTGNSYEIISVEPTG